jgi:hypothetical protein
MPSFQTLLMAVLVATVHAFAPSPLVRSETTTSTALYAADERTYIMVREYVTLWF